MFLFILFFISYSDSAKILGIFPIPSVSHQTVYQPIWKELSLRGHQVTVLTPIPLNNQSLINLTEIDMSETFSYFKRDYAGHAMAKDLFVVQTSLWILNILDEMTVDHLNKLRSFLEKSRSTFDLIIVETLHPLVYSLGCKFQVPIVAVISLPLMLQTHDSVGNPTHPIIGPDVFANIMSEQTFYDKLCSSMHSLIYRLVYYWYVLPKNDRISKTFWGEHCPYLGDLEKNVSLILVNSNSVLNPVRPHTPNIIQIGQLHLQKKDKLPKNLQKYLDLSENGVVYFSLGTNIRSANLSLNVRKKIVKAFSELPYNVLWKWENDDFSDKPKNVFTQKWFPQQAVLEHKNVKVFVSQGGLQSTEEAISKGVPILGLPFICDQMLNVMKITQTGLGRCIDHVSFTKDQFKEAIVDVAENKMYRIKLNKLKNIFTDQPIKGLEKSIFWIEYVLKHRGAKHLRSLTANTSFSEQLLFDLFLVFVILVVIMTFTILYLFK